MKTTRGTPSPLAVYRFAAGLTQRELAERAGLSRAAVVNLENGHSRPRRLTTAALAAVLRTDPMVLFPNEPLGQGSPQTPTRNDQRRPGRPNGAGEDRGGTPDGAKV